MRNPITLFAGIASATAIAASVPATAKDAANLPELSLEQKTSLRCAAAFALVAREQTLENDTARGWPPLGERGREFMVRVSARLMDDAQLERGQIAALLQREAQSLRDERQTHAIMPSCMLLLETSGI